jgi:hypothetical protein
MSSTSFLFCPLPPRCICGTHHRVYFEPLVDCARGEAKPSLPPPLGHAGPEGGGQGGVTLYKISGGEKEGVTCIRLRVEAQPSLPPPLGHAGPERKRGGGGALGVR